MPTNELSVAIFISLLSIIILVYLSYRVKSVLNEERDANEIIQGMLSEIGRRMKNQDMRILDQQIRLDIMDVKRGSLNAVRTLHEEHASNVVDDKLSITQNLPTVQFNDPIKSHDVTGTELSILRLLVKGAKSPIEIQRIIRLSREHVSRIMKEIYHKGLVSRETGERPYRYRLTNSGERLVGTSA